MLNLDGYGRENRNKWSIIYTQIAENPNKKFAGNK